MQFTGASIDIVSSLQGGLDALIRFLPNLLGALVILIIGYIIAKVLQKVVQKALEKLGVDRQLGATPHGGWVERITPGASVSRAISKVVFYLVFIFVLVAAVGALQIPAVTDFMNQVLAYLPNVIAALAIFIVAALVAAAIGALVARTMGDTPTGKVVAAVGPTLVMGIAVFMILTQLQIAPAIVQITYTALIGAIALGLALAFGLGGREVAADLLRSGYGKARDSADQVQQDAQLGSERARRDAAQATSQFSTGSSTGGATTSRLS